MGNLEHLATALRGLSANKMRSLLTILGIVIGVSSIVAIVSITEGARAESIRRIEAMGTNLLSVYPEEERQGAVRMGAESGKNLTPADVEAIRKCPSVWRVSPEIRQNGQVTYKNKNTNCRVYGVSHEWNLVRKQAFARGRMFTAREEEGFHTVAIVGPVVAKTLFGESNPIGRTIRINNTWFRVIGLTVPKGDVSFGDPDDQVTVPVTTAMKRLFGMNYVHRIRMEVKTTDLIPVAMSEIRSLLRRRHRRVEGQPDDFRFRDQAEFIEMRNEEGRSYTNLLASVAAVALIVGGVGIMNIMLVSVTERTREIGIRKAVGASNGDIQIQFMVESLTLSGLGGLLGIAVGVVLSVLLATHFEWKLTIVPAALVVSFLFAVGVGLFFGVYPARKAALLDPIEALRH